MISLYKTKKSIRNSMRSSLSNEEKEINRKSNEFFEKENTHSESKSNLEEIKNINDEKDVINNTDSLKQVDQNEIHTNNEQIVVDNLTNLSNKDSLNEEEDLCPVCDERKPNVALSCLVSILI